MLPPEQEGSVAHLLNEGIQAARQGDNNRAHSLLLQVIGQDERNERAWLWLSGVVETDEDRLVCLENVLAINPDSLSARKGLARLQEAGITAEPPPQSEVAPTEAMDTVKKVIRVERPPISAAAAVLYPERQIMELPWEEKTDLQTIPAVKYESHTVYNDIWEKETEICGFCAGEVAYDEKKCPQCERKLTISQFRYPKPSADLIVYFVLIVSTAQLYFIQALLDLIAAEPILVAAWHIFEFLVLLGLSGAILMRQFWAYTTSIVILILIFLSMVLDITTGLGEVKLAVIENGVAYFEAMADSAFMTLFSPLLDFLVPFQMLAIFLALLYGLFKAGPDFERVRARLIAQVDKGLHDASAYYSAGKVYAKEEMWASAVLHFQRAAAHEPNRAYYHLAAGKAFAQLGFKERAMDALFSAQRLATSDELKTEIKLSIATVKG
jgi:tetratricopeptide (TPR) repeat protein